MTKIPNNSFQALGPMTLEALHSLVAGALDASTDEFSVDENLIELGLTSIALMGLHRALTGYGLTVPVSRLAADPTVEKWMGLLSDVGPSGSCWGESPFAARPDDGAPFPLTDIQRAYWLGRDPSFELGGVGAHGYLEVRASCVLADRLEDALNETVAMHPMLRAVIREDGLQQVLENVPRYPIDRRDLRSLSPEDKIKAFSQLRAEMSHRVFDPENWPLFSLTLTRVSEEVDVLHIDFDILVFDLKSLEVWLDDLFQRYAFPGAPLLRRENAFRDYILEKEGRRQSAECLTALAYWREKARFLPLGPKLPLQCPLQDRTSVRFARCQRVLSSAQWARFKKAAQAQGVTPSAALLAVYAQALGEIGQTDCFSLVVTLFDRGPAGGAMERVVGDFTSLTLVDFDLRQPRDMQTFARSTQRVLWQALDHAAVSGVEVLSLLGAREGAPNRALVPYVFTSALGTGRSYLDAVEQFGTITYAAVQTPQVLLDHQVLEQKGGLVLNWDYVEAAFPETLIDLLASRQAALVDMLSQSENSWETFLASGQAGTKTERWEKAEKEDYTHKKGNEEDQGATDREVSSWSAWERGVQKVWSDVLGYAVRQRDDNFFLIGGNSLLATHLARSLGETFETSVGVLSVFEHTTIKKQARFLAERAVATGPNLEPDGSGGSDVFPEKGRSFRRGLSRERRMAALESLRPGRNR